MKYCSALVLFVSSAFALADSATLVSEESVSVTHGDISLAGSLLIPPPDELVAGIVMLHGSGPQDRSSFRPLATRLANQGIATLIFDKRGTGQSTGSWINASLRDLGADGAAAVGHLANDSRLKDLPIGVWSISQSTWYAPIVARLEAETDFLVAVTGGGQTPRDVEWYGYEKAIEQANLTDSQTAAARRLIRSYFDYLATGLNRQELESLIAAGKDEPYYAAVPVGRILPSDANRQNWEWVATYEPLIDIEKLTIPALIMLGADDKLVQSDKAMKRWQLGLARSDAPPPTIRMFPNAGHGLTTGGHGHGAGARYVAGYIEDMVDWISIRNSQH